MGIRQVEVQRFSLISSKSIDDVMASLDAGVGHPDMSAFFHKVAGTKKTADLEALVGEAVSPAGLMEFARFDMGAILRMYHGEKAARCFRLLIGNPLIMKQMAEHVHDAASYAPVTVVIDEREDGVHLSYDRMASYLASYGNLAALEVARELDLKVEHLLTRIAS